MPLYWDWSETKAAKQEGRLWKEIVKVRGGKEYTDEEGNKWISPEWNLFTVIPMIAYPLLGGRYGERGMEWLEGKVFVLNRKTAEKVIDRVFRNQKLEDYLGIPREEIVEGIVGLKVWASPFK